MKFGWIICCVIALARGMLVCDDEQGAAIFLKVLA
jgi:hypothetical protein